MDLSMLNPEQRKAAETLEGPVLILAGAGSGKTRTLTYRVANLIDHGVEPYHILALTFTNKAAREMKERITALIGDKAEDAWISTFHSSCARILRKDIEKIGYERSFTIFDDDDQNAVLKEIYKRMNIDDKNLPIKMMRSVISDAKNELLSPDEWFQNSPRDYQSQRIHDIYLEYETRLKGLNALDFDDLLLKTLQLLADHPPVLEYYRQRFQYVLVDEYQDTNKAQYELVHLLTASTRNLCVVGDDDQSIYGWRGADIRNILEFEKDYPGTTVIKLEQNYRSTANILDAANQVIAHNEGRKEKLLWTEADEGEKIHVYCACDEKEEAAWIADVIRQYHKEGEKYGSFAILYRANSQSRALEEMLMRSGIPYVVFGGQKFYERKEIRDITAYLRVLANPSDDLSLRRIINVPRRSIGDSTVQILDEHAQALNMPLYTALTDMPESLASRPRKCVAEFANLMNELLVLKETMPLEDFIVTMIDKVGLKEPYEKDKSDDGQARLENINEMIAAVRDYAQHNENATLEGYLENVALVMDIDGMEESPDYVMLMTLHSSKGLEFPNVFISGMEEGVFPSYRSLEDEEKMEEERRLCYVGITRARKRLFLCRAESRMTYAQANYNAPSRFLEEIPKRLIEDDLSTQRAKNFGKAVPQQSRTPMKAQPRAVKRPGDPLGVSISNPLNIPGVTKGFVTSPARAMAPADTGLYKPGDHVQHRKFGVGEVKEVVGSGAEARIRIEFTAYGMREFILNLAPIAKLEE
ncbi:MAG: DNA helicase PcrA [Clostridia bacterium]|nr:DNA helicase PcrA [Clostridia bacterium]